ncbi:uncharacterized protein A1O5_10344 [Cladophialophora psammophila CBS 110553]|uniref:Xylanolytic transcriptional activator regulatory domain-containing protein n=1 Tax=Cladophialophora psammophila CBS 110553 TaxID=1182543 RepID=W9WFF6_9EURO|nr:uncharacterized protein A1O5_10344 [Cladophialophora psammophila CBS 110553]EXJ66673.1 hypothetical protein A1O5_10344 [Cladophialophora psammophila CBS 110553]
MFTLEWLQGCILCAYYHLASNPKQDTELLVDAYRLELHEMDMGNDQNPSDHNQGQSAEPLLAEIWVTKEEQRRAWWLVWELDTFLSATLCYPSTIDRSRMHVLLPVSDEAWFMEMPAPSASIHPEISICWKSLLKSPNRSERAWFLVSTHIATHIYELGQRAKVRGKDIEVLERARSSFCVTFQKEFRDGIKDPTFDASNYARKNWLLLSQLMLESFLQILAAMLRE